MLIYILLISEAEVVIQEPRKPQQDVIVRASDGTLYLACPAGGNADDCADDGAGDGTGGGAGGSAGGGAGGGSAGGSGGVTRGKGATRGKG